MDSIDGLVVSLYQLFLDFQYFMIWLYNTSSGTWFDLWAVDMMSTFKRVGIALVIFNLVMYRFFQL